MRLHAVGTASALLAATSRNGMRQELREEYIILLWEAPGLDQYAS
jgi:hypothetical protein